MSMSTEEDATSRGETAISFSEGTAITDGSHPEDYSQNVQPHHEFQAERISEASSNPPPPPIPLRPTAPSIASAEWSFPSIYSESAVSFGDLDQWDVPQHWLSDGTQEDPTIVLPKEDLSSGSDETSLKKKSEKVSPNFLEGWKIQENVEPEHLTRMEDVTISKDGEKTSSSSHTRTSLTLPVVDVDLRGIPEDKGLLDRMALQTMNEVKDLIQGFEKEAEDGKEIEIVPRPSTIPRQFRPPSIESFFNQQRTTELKLYIDKGKRMISKEVRLDTRVWQIKYAIGHLCHVHPEALDIRLRRNLVAEFKSLEELGAKAEHVFWLHVNVTNRSKGEGVVLILSDDDEDVDKEGSEGGISQHSQGHPDIERWVDVSPGKKVKVIISHPTKEKNTEHYRHFKDKRKNKTFTDMSTTVEKAYLFEDFKPEEHRKESATQKANKCTQSFNERTFGVQTRLHTYTQVERVDYHVCEQKDKLLTSKPYKTYEQIMQERNHAASIIQKHFRRLLARRQVEKRLNALVARVGWVDRIRKGRFDERKRIQTEEEQRLQSPKRLVDLELLYREINRWRKEQEEFVTKNRWGAERKAALALIVEMESDLLLHLERTRKKLLDEGRYRMMYKELEEMTTPPGSRWYNAHAKGFLQVSFFHKSNKNKGNGDNPRPSTASTSTSTLKLQEYLKGLSNPVEDVEERVKLITEINQMLLQNEAVRKGEVHMADMLSDLFTRELLFIKKQGVDGKGKLKGVLEATRHRIVNTFFHLCKDPKFNEDARRMDKMRGSPEGLAHSRNMMQCKSCKRIFPKDQFTIEKGTILTSRCLRCTGLYRTSIQRLDLNIYRQMLKEIRRDEFEAGVTNSMSFLLDACDMKLLVERIWHGQSALSGIDDRYMLRLCRWRKKEPWSPWNCILLAEEEAIAHLQIKPGHLEAKYQPTLFQKVRLRHYSAKVYFQGLAKLAPGLDPRVQDACQRIWKMKEKRVENTGRFRTKAEAIGLFSQFISIAGIGRGSGEEGEVK